MNKPQLTERQTRFLESADRRSLATETETSEAYGSTTVRVRNPAHLDRGVVSLSSWPGLRRGGRHAASFQQGAYPYKVKTIPLKSLYTYLTSLEDA